MNKINSKFVTYDYLDKIGEIAIYYGFTPRKSPSITKSDLELAEEIADTGDDSAKEKTSLRIEEKIALLRTFNEEGLYNSPQPTMYYFKDSCHGSIHRYADLEILGHSGPIAEATLIQTARVMLAEEGYKNTIVEINSIGDRDSLARFSRELTSYYRKHINDMSTNTRELFKKDSFELLACQEKECQELNNKAPKALDYLSEAGRRHLEEILEYLEALNIPYNVNNSLIGNKKYCGETMFTIVDGKTDKDRKVLALGMRYDTLAKRVGTKKDIQGVGISLIIKGGKESNRKIVKKMKKPIASFIQLGLESKLLSLQIVESLRLAKVPLYLSLTKDRLGAQVSSVEKYHTPYVIVIGKKEAVDRTAIVRKNDTHSQEVISLSDLPNYMKKIESQLNK